MDKSNDSPNKMSRRLSGTGWSHYNDRHSTSNASNLSGMSNYNDRHNTSNASNLSHMVEDWPPRLDSTSNDEKVLILL